MNGARKIVMNRRGSISGAAAVLLILVPLALEVGGCPGGHKPVGWSKLSPAGKPAKKGAGSALAD